MHKLLFTEVKAHVQSPQPHVPFLNSHITVNCDCTIEVMQRYGMVGTTMHWSLETTALHSTRMTMVTGYSGDVNETQDGITHKSL